MPGDTDFPIVEKCYDLVIWLHGRTAKFPRYRKQGIGLRIENEVLDLYELLRAASTKKQRHGELAQASEMLNRLRGTLRIALGLRLLSLKQFGHAAQLMDEVGRMLGGWMRRTGQSATTEGKTMASSSPAGVAKPQSGMR